MRAKLFLLLLCSATFLTYGQKKKPKKIRNINAEIVKKDPKKFGGNHLFAGKVVFEHDGTKFYCDSAVHYNKQNILLAWSNVRVQNDTIRLDADSLRYNGKAKVSKAWNNVKLKDRRQTITADYMEFNRNSNIARATGNVVVIDKERTTKTENLIYNRNQATIFNDQRAVITNKDGSTIVSEKGTYDLNNKTNDFLGQVNINNKDYTIDSDRALFDQKNNTADFYGWTKIVSKKNPKNYIITTRGKFNNKTGIADLMERSTIYFDGKELHGDKIHHEKNTGFGRAQGNVWLNDPQENRWIKGQYAESFEKKDSAFVTGEAYLVKAFEKDSLYFHADTIVTVKRPDSTQLVRGYFKAKFFKGQLSGKADSVSYNETDGVLRFYRDPVVWSENQQITGDTIFVYNDQKVEVTDSIRVIRNAFVISKVDTIQEHKDYNQVKGRSLLALFYENNLKWIEIEGNAQSLTFMDEDKDGVKDRVGINRSDCGIIEVQIAKRNVDILACKINTTSKLYPESQLPEKQRYLPDFNWREAERLKKWQDIFIDYEDIDLNGDFGSDLEEDQPKENKPKSKPKANLKLNIKPQIKENLKVKGAAKSLLKTKAKTKK